MVKINPNYKKLKPSYFFSETTKRVKEFEKKNPNVEVLKLGIGNTTQALPPIVINGLIKGVKKLADKNTYTGYGDEQGDIRLREALVKWYKNRGIVLDPSEIFISDGAKPDTANISSLFSSKSIIAIQNPVYPVYRDSNIISGKTNILYMNCTEKNGFVPEVPKQKVDLIYLCSPNNPTGTVISRKKLTEFVGYAKKENTVIIFDSAYSEFVKDREIPKSIYEINGAKECAIEIQSFSKFAGFTGVRLGWTIVPKELETEDSVPGQLNQMWNRRQTTMFNGASNIAQEGGLAVLSSAGQKECLKIIKYYMENARIIKNRLEKMGFSVYGGIDAPYLWVKTPRNISSWEFFNKLLEEAHVVCTPGIGFGSEGEGYVRVSAFGHRENVVKAVESIKRNFKL